MTDDGDGGATGAQVEWTPKCGWKLRRPKRGRKLRRLGLGLGGGGVLGGSGLGGGSLGAQAARAQTEDSGRIGVEGARVDVFAAGAQVDSISGLEDGALKAHRRIDALLKLAGLGPLRAQNCAGSAGRRA